MSKLLITGGHLTPALAFIDWLTRHHPEWTVVFVGREFAQIDNAQPSWEREEIEARDLTFIPFEAQKTGRFNPFTYHRTVTAATQILTENQITHVLSFGGYLALPFALAARQLRLPLVTHEQTRVLGRANRVLALLADQTALSFADTRRPWFIRHPTITGNPLRQGLFDSEAVRPDWFRPTQNLPLLYVAGGSQGAARINDLLLPILTPLSEDFLIVHQVGRRSAARDPLAQVQDYVSSHYTALTNYFPREFLSVDELAYLYPRTSIAVSRSGANTVAELAAFAIPTLFIPLPESNYDEQFRNADALARLGAALVRRQNELTPAILLETITQLACDQDQIAAALDTVPKDTQACEQLFTLLTQIPPKLRRQQVVKKESNENKSDQNFTKIPINEEKLKGILDPIDKKDIL